MPIFKMNQWALVVIDAAVSVITLWCAVSLRNEDWFTPATTAAPQVALALIGAPLIMSLFGCYRSLDISPSYQNVIILTKAAGVFGVLFLAAGLYLHPTGIPRSVGLIYPLMFLVAVISSRLTFERFARISDELGSRLSQKKIYVYGAGQAGRSILAFLRNQPWTVEAFLDDDVTKIGRVFHHVKIKAPSTLGPAEHEGVETVLLALPSINGVRRTEIYEYLNSLGYEVLTVPTIGQMALGGSEFAELRGIKIDDLLERSVMNADPVLMEMKVRGKTVLVTGAGGSIGAELSRQIVRLGASRLILFDHSEFQLFQIDRELTDVADRSAARCILTSILGSICSESDVSSIFHHYRIDIAFHAAAYKHVHLLENNEFRGLYNNVIGTKIIVDACVASGVDSMVLISTDKAVRPTSLMGMSKRVAELIVKTVRGSGGAGETRFAVVRFGNVLGSNGSVIPIFEEQIRGGGPVTVTDPLVTRYFMTMPEASSLVIQASAMSLDSSDIFVLDMGDPVQITLLAERLIEMAGKKSTYDAPASRDEIQIIFTGLKPGEKLHEELFISSEAPRPTAHPRIFSVHDSPPAEYLADQLEVLCETLQCHDGSVDRAWGEFLSDFLRSIDG